MACVEGVCVEGKCVWASEVGDKGKGGSVVGAVGRVVWWGVCGKGRGQRQVMGVVGWCGSGVCGMCACVCVGRGSGGVVGVWGGGVGGVGEVWVGIVATLLHTSAITTSILLILQYHCH